MNKNYTLSIFKLILLPLFFLVVFISCNDTEKDVADKEVVETPEEINARAEAVIQGTLKQILQNSNELADSFKIKNALVLEYLYEQNSFQPHWSSRGAFIETADSLLTFIEDSHRFGLFPEDYYFKRLTDLKNQLILDTAKEKKLDASLWAYSDMMLSSAFIQIVKDLKIGRLLPDSIIAKDSSLNEEFYLTQFKYYKQNGNSSFAEQLEPNNTDYRKIKSGLQTFLDSADFKKYTFVSRRDSAIFRRLLIKRLSEVDSAYIAAVASPDSSQLANAIKRYQRYKNIKVDGKVTTSLITRLNETDKEKFIRIAINLDRYKLLQPLPKQYVWVNLPSYYLQLRDNDTVVLRSRVVIGKPITRTPIITSSISDMMTYPKWTIPESIIKKEILPGLKRDPGYTTKKGYILVDKDGNEVNPYSEVWAKYKEMIPYKVVQGSGDDNALGVLKFNFPNKHSVYLHDTNQRYLFSRTSRALSHGCVRVQAWEELAKFILRNDSVHTSNAIKVDSMRSWLAAKQKRYIPVRKPLPLFIRYFTIDTNKEGRLVFYEDIYGEDKQIRDKLFASK
ncbi:MAG: L,D-transpeptidase family protein [Flavisolibacter sp.]